MTPFFPSLFFFFNATATTEIYTLSLHDALPISAPTGRERSARRRRARRRRHGQAGDGHPVKIARSPYELEHRPRAVAIGTFDGVHLGHRAVIRSVLDSGLTPTVVTFEPHPRLVLGNQVELLT